MEVLGVDLVLKFRRGAEVVQRCCRAGAHGCRGVVEQVQWCWRGVGEEAETRSRGGQEVVKRWSRGGQEVVKRWSRGVVLI
jgi:hypothetical protein